MLLRSVRTSHACNFQDMRKWNSGRPTTSRKAGYVPGSKMIEKVIFNQLSEYLIGSYLLVDSAWFWDRCILHCDYCAWSYWRLVLKYWQQSNYQCIFLDLKKTFDMVVHNTLLKNTNFKVLTRMQFSGSSRTYQIALRALMSLDLCQTTFLLAKRFHKICIWILVFSHLYEKTSRRQAIVICTYDADDASLVQNAWTSLIIHSHRSGKFECERAWIARN